MRQRDALIAGAAVAALLLWSRSARASINPRIDVTYTGDMQEALSPSEPDPVGYHDPVYSPEDSDPWALDALGVGLPDFTQVQTMEAADDPLISAFLYAIRRSEHAAADVASGIDYRTFFGGDRFTNLSDHPVITGEMKGVPLPREMCIAAGYPNGVCVSTAAGAYQMIRPTWVTWRNRSPRLPDFSPRSQDIAAGRILQSLGVQRLLYAGDVQGAIMKASSQWASLPGSTARQGGRTMDFVVAAYQQAGGQA